MTVTKMAANKNLFGTFLYFLKIVIVHNKEQFKMAMKRLC